MTVSSEHYAQTKTLEATGDNGVAYAYRSTGDNLAEPPLLLLQHFRGNLDNWDPALVDALAQERHVIAFDNTGVGASTGRTPHSIAAMAEDALDFVDALDLIHVDLLGFSIGSFVAQEVSLRRPDLVERIVLASAAPRGASGMHGWAPDIIDAVGRRELSPEGYLRVFFAATEAGLRAGQLAAQRIFGERTEKRDDPTLPKGACSCAVHGLVSGLPPVGRLRD
jgi:pimeloyl-ACP methyl ester carboxylesterase